jgi:hypothetical protein
MNSKSKTFTLTILQFSHNSIRTKHSEDSDQTSHLLRNRSPNKTLMALLG